MTATSSDELDLPAALRGLLALQVAEREERHGRAEPRLTEVILDEAGLSHGAIALITGKKKDTVRKAVERARKKPAMGRADG